MKLTTKEISELRHVLEVFENSVYVDSGMKSINGGYARADMFDYDDEMIDIEVEWGRQDMGDGHSTCHVEQYTIDRETITADIPLAEKVAKIEFRS